MNNGAKAAFTLASESTPTAKIEFWRTIASPDKVPASVLLSGSAFVALVSSLVTKIELFTT